MLLKLIAVLGVGAVLLSVAFSMWREGVFRTWMTTSRDKPPEIVFDNGSVRDLPVPAASSAARTVALSPPGVMRKCVRGDRITYSNLTCPAGFREKPIAQDGVTVVPGVKTAGSPKPQPGVAPHEAMREALDLKRDEKLRQRMIDKAIEAEAR